MYWLWFDNGFGKSFWREKGSGRLQKLRQNRCHVTLYQRLYNIHYSTHNTSGTPLAYLIVRPCGAFKRKFPLKNHLFGRLDFSTRHHQATYFFYRKKVHKKLVAFLAKRRHQTAPSFTWTDWLFLSRKVSKQHRPSTRTQGVCKSIECKHRKTANLPPDVRKLTLVAGLATRHTVSTKVEPSASCEW